jgi:hypothetical protein
MVTLHLEPKLTDKEVASLAGHMLNIQHYDLLVQQDCDGYDKETGKILFKFRKKVIPSNIAEAAYRNLRTAVIESDNRGMSAGVITDYEADKLTKELGFTGWERVSEHRIRFLKKDGTLSNTIRAKRVYSGIIGYFDRDVRFPYCRQTAFNEKHLDRFNKAYPLIKRVNELYKKLLPEHYAFQESVALASSKDFVIKDTVFTTITVNKNWQTAVHKDKGDLEGGFGNLVVLRAGQYEGGYFVLPKWRVAIDLNNCDVLFVDVHQWHGNTPIIGNQGEYERVSLVMYYRENIQYCGTAFQEAEEAKRMRDRKNIKKKTIQ